MIAAVHYLYQFVHTATQLKTVDDTEKSEQED